MRINRSNIFLIICALACTSQSIANSATTNPSSEENTMEPAKRRAPRAKPVTHLGVKYEQMLRPMDLGYGQSGGIIAAIDIATGEQLWTLRLYETKFDVTEERDGQEVYVVKLTIDADTQSLIATDERHRRWKITLADRTVSQIK